MSDYNKLARNIAKGKLPYENWNQYYTQYLKSSNILAGVQFSLNLVSAMYTPEIWQEESAEKLGKDFLQILWKTLDNGFELDKCEESIRLFREKAKSHMDCLVTYTDHFMTYQYIINCMTYRFEDYDYDDYDDEEFTKELMNFILADKDQSNIKYKMMEVLKSLPIRMTGSRFFEMVKDGYSVYNGSDMDSLKSFDYMVRGAALLSEPKDMEKNFPELYKYDRHFSQLEYDKLDSESFYKEKISLMECIDYLNNQITACQSFAEGINQLYSFVLTHEYAQIESEVYENCRSIFDYLRSNTKPGESEDIEDELTELLVNLEGLQEDELENLEEADGVFNDITLTTFAASAPEQIHKERELVDNLGKLLSTSYFADLDENIDDTPASEADVNSMFARFKEELQSKIKGMPKLMSRAIFAAVIGYLPMNFSSDSELKEYIYNSLRACTNIPEKMALVERLESVMDEDEDFD